MTLRTRLSNFQIVWTGWLRRKAINFLFGRQMLVCTCGAVVDYKQHRVSHFLCGHRLTNTLRGLSHRCARREEADKTYGERITELEESLWGLSEVEAGHAQACVDRLKLFREQLKLVNNKLDAAGGLCSLGEVPSKKVDNLIERYKLLRSYVRGVSERQRTIERALGVSTSLDGPQRFRDEACELLIQVLEYCPQDTMPLLVTRITNLLDRSGYSEWNQE